MCFAPVSPEDSLRLMMTITGNIGVNAGVLLKLLISIRTSAVDGFVIAAVATVHKQLCAITEIMCSGICGAKWNRNDTENIRIQADNVAHFVQFQVQAWNLLFLLLLAQKKWKQQLLLADFHQLGLI